MAVGVRPRMSNPIMCNKMWDCPKMSNAFFDQLATIRGSGSGSFLPSLSHCVFWRVARQRGIEVEWMYCLKYA